MSIRAEGRNVVITIRYSEQRSNYGPATPIAAAGARMGEPQWTAARDEGRALALEHAVEYALADAQGAE
jgi:hypothetical protein